MEAERINDSYSTKDSHSTFARRAGPSKSSAAPRPFIERPCPPEPQPASGFNRMLDGIAGPRDFFAGLEVSPYIGYGVCGMMAGFCLMTGLGLWLKLSIATLSAFAMVAVLTFLLVGLLRKAIFRRDDHVLLEDLLLVLATTALLAWALREPVELILDLLMLGLGAFLLAGRVGCLVCGCCHGRPSRFGIRYGDGAVEEALAGIRLFPIQLIEAVWIAALTFAGTVFVLAGALPGTALWFWLLGYGSGRFVFEFARGDARRRRFGPLTEAQWIALLLLSARVIYEATRAGFNPAPLLIYGAAAGLALTLYATRRWWLAAPSPAIRLSQVSAWQRFLEELEREATTPLSQREVVRPAPSGGFNVGLLIDAADDNLAVHSYSLRGSPEPLELREALAVSGMMMQRWPAHSILRASYCEAGVFHLWALVNPEGEPGSTLEDAPSDVLLRAHAFSQSLMLTPPVPARPALEIDPRLMPLPARVPDGSEMGWRFRGPSSTPS